MLLKKLFALLLVCSLLLGASSALAAVSPLEDPSVIPETTEEGFLPEGVSPYYFKDHAAGYWFYLDQTVRIEIMRAQTSSPKLTYIHGGHHVRRGHKSLHGDVQ